MISTLTKQGTNNFAISALRTFDAWGNIRLGAQTGDPKGHYCGNLGHKQDDESGLLYMRSRYYEPTTGRFVNEDSGRQGPNWFSYCQDNPINCADQNGQWSMPDAYDFLMAAGFLFAGLAALSLSNYNSSYMGQVSTGQCLNYSAGYALLATACFALAQLGASGVKLIGSLPRNTRLAGVADCERKNWCANCGRRSRLGPLCLRVDT